MRSAFVFLAASSLVVCLASEVAASGFSTARFGGEHGHPTADNPTEIYYNPSGIALTPGIDLYGDAAIAYRLAKYVKSADADDVAEPDGAAGANTGEATLTNVVAAPMLGATLGFPVSDNIDLAFGAGFFVPFGGTAVWDQNDKFDNNSTYPGPVDGVQRWYSIHGTIRTIYISGAAAIGINKLIYIGISGGVALNQIDSLRARTATGDNDVTNEGRAWLDAEKFNGQLGGGIMLTPLDGKLRVGASYQAPPGINRQTLRGNLHKHLGGQISGGSDNEKVDVHQHMPDIFRAGISYRLANDMHAPQAGDMEFRLFGDYTRWSLFDDQCIGAAGRECEVEENGADAEGTSVESGGAGTQANLPRRWNDAGAVRFGMSYWITPMFELMGGVGYDSNAIPGNTLDPALLDFHDISASLAVEFRPIRQFAAMLGYTHIFYISRDTTGHSSLPQFVGSSRGPDAGGEYSQTIGVFQVNVEANFDPFTPSPPTTGALDP